MRHGGNISADVIKSSLVSGRQYVEPLCYVNCASFCVCVCVRFPLLPVAIAAAGPGPLTFRYGSLWRSCVLYSLVGASCAAYVRPAPHTMCPRTTLCPRVFIPACHKGAGEGANPCPMSCVWHRACVCVWMGQPGNPYKGNVTEPFTRLQAAISTISAGPVAPSDKIGYSDAALIMMSCMKDGRLLQVQCKAVQCNAVQCAPCTPPARTRTRRRCVHINGNAPGQRTRSLALVFEFMPPTLHCRTRARACAMAVLCPFILFPASLLCHPHPALILAPSTRMCPHCHAGH